MVCPEETPLILAPHVPGGFLAIDPGRSTGWAFGTGPTPPEMTAGHGIHSASRLRPSRVLIELPQIYDSRETDPNDLVTLTIRASAYGCYFRSLGASVYCVLPRVWKGSIKKEIHHRRARRDLPEYTKKAEGFGAGTSDVMDAVLLFVYWAKKGFAPEREMFHNVWPYG